MSGAIGLKTVKNGLIFLLDVTNTKSISQAPKTNLLLWSQDFSKFLPWYTGGATVTSTTYLAPDYTNTACILDDTNASVSPGVTVQSFIASSTIISYSIYTKDINSGDRTFLLRNTTTSTNFVGYIFTYTATASVASGWTFSAAGNGWYRLSYTRSIGISIGDTLTIYYGRTGAAAAGSTASWAVWGAQAELGTVTDYILSQGTQGNRNTIYDLTPTKSDGTLYNNSGLTASSNLTGLNFNGSTQYINLLNNISLPNDFTISVILKLTSTDVTLEGRSTILADNSGTSILNTELSTRTLTINNMGAYIKNVYSIPTLNPSTIYNIVLTRDYSNIIDVYVNNTMVDNNLNINTHPGTFNINSLFQAFNNRFFNGNLYSISIYNRILSNTELTQNFNALKKKYNFIAVTASDISQATMDILKVRTYSEGATFENETTSLLLYQNFNNNSLLGSASFILTPNGYKENIIYPAKPYINNYNLLYGTENFTIWSGTSSFTVTPDSATAPDGTFTMDKIIINNGISGSASLAGPLQTITKIPSYRKYTYSIYAQQAGFNGIYVCVDESGTSSTSAARYAVNLTDGSVGYTASVSGNFLTASGTVDSIGNGTYRVNLAFTSGTASTLNIRQWVYNNSTTSDTGDGTNGIYLWGAQLVEGDKLLYQKLSGTQATTQLVTYTRGSLSTKTATDGSIANVPYNYLRYSNDLGNSNWSTLGGSITVSSNFTVAPDGSYTATRLQFSGASVSRYQYPYVIALQVGLPTAGATFCTSIYVKGNSGESISLSFGGSNSQTSFTMSGIWQRLSYNGTAFDRNTGLSINTFNSVTARDILVWGAQFVIGTNSQPLLSTTDKSNMPVIDYIAGTAAIRCLVNSENLLLYSETFTQSNWVKYGISVTGSNVLAPCNTYAASTITATYANAYIMQQLPASNNSQRVPLFSCYMRRASGTGNVWLETGPIISTVSLTGSWNRYTVDSLRMSLSYSSTNGFYTFSCIAPHGMTYATTFRFNYTSFTGFNSTASNIVDTTTFNCIKGTASESGSGNFYPQDVRIRIGTANDQIDIWGAQLIGAGYVNNNDTYSKPVVLDYNKDYIPTTTSQITRTTDILSINNMYYNNLVTGTYGCIMFEMAVYSSMNGFYTTVDQIYLTNTAGQNFITISLNYSNVNYIYFQWVANNNATMFGTTYVVTLKTFYKILLRYTSSTVDLFINGVKVGSTYNITVARDTTLNRILTASPYLLIKSINFFPYTLSDAQCQNLTT